ncbi:MAG: hypothetical protein K2I90_03340 [Odoribacter sp.]|nr:hypothetical protein [Odoribacter sp.]
MEQILRETRDELARNQQQWRSLYRDYVKLIRDYKVKVAQPIPNDSSRVEKFLFKESDNNRVVKLLLDIFKKKTHKVLNDIQPVMLNRKADMHLAMPVPFTVEAGKIKYTATEASEYIDIIARKDKGFNNRPCIMSVVSDEKNGDYWLAAKRALKYAVFMAALLRSENRLGYAWWNVIRDQNTDDKDVPEKTLKIDVVVAFPEGKEDLSHFAGAEEPLEELNFDLRLHTLYYNKPALLNGTLTKFSGSYA